MRNLGDTIGRLAALSAAATAAGAAAPGADALADLSLAGSNPGALRARVFVPAGLPAGAPLVVVLHGCTQSAADYDRGAGWSALAQANGFALLFPEQCRGNNANLCFNWFAPGDSRRGEGEAESIRQMIEAMVSRHRLDRGRIHITGLSAGGAMAMTMLSVHPELFAGGAVIAGVSHGIASTVPEAFDRMRGQGLPAPAALAARVRQASAHRGAWPTLSVWHGSADATVDPANGDAIAASWALLHGAVPAPIDTLAGHPRRAWRDAHGHIVVEAISIAGMGHGTPLATTGPEALGQAQPHMLDVGLSSTRRIAAFWAIAPAVAAPVAAASQRPPVMPAPGWPDAQAVIGQALRQAGLLR
jgi:poly(hydroxyalkanoate) depolymerase family esterase